MTKLSLTRHSNRAALVARWEEIAPAALRPASRLVRKHSAQKKRTMRASIAESGIISPIVVNAAGVIVDGHLRAEQALALNLPSVPVVRVQHLSEAELRAFAIAANRLPANATWDENALRIELEEIKALDVELDLSLTGFSIGEIDRILGNHLNDLYDDLDTPEEPARTKSKGRVQQGDIWALGCHRIICGDSTDPAVIARLMDGEEARAAFTDPPYNVAINGHVSGTGQHGEFAMASGEMSRVEFTAFLGTALTNLERHLIDGGIAFVCMDHAHIGELIEVGDNVFAERLNICVWDKGQGGMGALYRSQHELVAVFKKGCTPHINNVLLGKNGRNRTNVWSFPGMAGFGKGRKKALELHPTVKPVALVAEALLDVSCPNDLVLDLFGGSGSTLIACERIGRRARLSEFDPLYVERTLDRWEALGCIPPVLLEQTGDDIADATDDQGACRDAPQAMTEVGDE